MNTLKTEIIPLDPQLKIFFKNCCINPKFTVVLCLLYSGVFAQYSNRLHLTSGDRIECRTIKLVFTSQLLCYLCNGDTIQPETIIGMSDTAGYHPYFKNAFLSRIIAGKLSLYSGNVPSLEISNTSGMQSGLSVEPEFQKKKFYTFDDSVFYEFHTFKVNHTLEAKFGSHPDASRFYAGYRLSNVISIAGLGTSIIPLIGGLFALSDHRTQSGISLLVTSAAGVTISTILHGIIGKRYLKKSIESYNKNSSHN